MKAFFIIRMDSDNRPDLNGMPYHGFVFCDQIGQWGTYLVSGTGLQLKAIDALSHVYGICVVTESSDVRWGELDDVPTAAIRNRLNIWLTNHNQSMIPADWTARQIIRAIYRRFNEHFDLARFDVADVS